MFNFVSLHNYLVTRKQNSPATSLFCLNSFIIDFCFKRHIYHGHFQFGIMFFSFFLKKQESI